MKKHCSALVKVSANLGCSKKTGPLTAVPQKADMTELRGAGARLLYGRAGPCGPLLASHHCSRPSLSTDRATQDRYRIHKNGLDRQPDNILPSGHSCRQHGGMQTPLKSHSSKDSQKEFNNVCI
ncbi:hypothetical protein EYF80_001191 [Liparis tanakae]|uniref:Uncharacterized protein n=1 Tax=Liparis tanakae TaxID=230148 RepID=A0A4Z2JDW3_9TELE|nr:hypothetical protein EYF80_001191 [Liparis tanakae]